MANKPPEPSIVKWPTDSEAKTAFKSYTLALGKVAHAWNYLHEKLGQLFVVITGAERDMALAIWYSTDSDGTQRKMLEAAVAVNNSRWEQWPKAKDDLAWLLDGRIKSPINAILQYTLRVHCTSVVANTGA